MCIYAYKNKKWSERTHTKLLAMVNSREGEHYTCQTFHSGHVMFSLLVEKNLKYKKVQMCTIHYGRFPIKIIIIFNAGNYLWLSGNFLIQTPHIGNWPSSGLCPGTLSLTLKRIRQPAEPLSPCWAIVQK